MGLDLVVEGCAKAGHEKEWHDLLARSFADEKLTATEIAHFQDISVPGYERIGDLRLDTIAPQTNGYWRRMPPAKSP